MPRRRLDDELVRRALASNAGQALTMIREGRVIVDGAPALKPSALISDRSAVQVRSSRRRYASRAGEKLEGALAELGIAVTGKKCLDAGAGQGGFTDCLLRHGAAHVTAVDVGYGDFDWSLRNDSRIALLERTNLRTARPSSLGGPFDLVVADLSFISLRAVVKVLVEVVKEGGELLFLVKPQFEAARDQVEAGGLISDPSIWKEVLGSVTRALGEQGAGVAGIAASRLRGARGNQEFFILGGKGSPGSDTRQMIESAVEGAS